MDHALKSISLEGKKKKSLITGMNRGLLRGYVDVDDLPNSPCYSAVHVVKGEPGSR